ncbi:hypothetical protein NVP1238A_67 [Vibrio phage 1.238.A._10N.261.52.F10]|uniref:Uncharacterized protein n=1 Tax=Vibrio phage 1.238.A._10N.261.52.F10 TaxID=1881231 RepID=A0A2I7RUH7_9CAUD|nr:hypothetical protein KNT79_gp67 [Vibrio phage 1.238.A._10N.261.52.F10]AUR97316.1 hypothetical protein NVP1238A_67 [Vibrio phage 1.238.A._10N.261.52.F10]AUR97410.1 hypothetical protein NVP1238B_68 [Vibrio phage 1.238.B._10N.261.52.F10]
MNKQQQLMDHILNSIKEDFLVFADEGEYSPEDLVGGVAMAFDLMAHSYGADKVETEHYHIKAKETEVE